MEYMESLNQYRTDYRGKRIVCGVALAREKKPLGIWRKAEAMSFEEALGKGLEAEDLGFYIQTGAVSGLTVVDLDNKADDFAELVETVKSFCVGIKPAIVATGGGGRHYYFRYCPDITTGAEKKEAGCSGIDIRNDRGIVIAPPTIHVSGKQYEFIAGDIGNLPDMPEGLLNWLLEKHGKGRIEKNVAGKKDKRKNCARPVGKDKWKRIRHRPGELIIKETVYKGCRDDALFHHLCSRRGSGYTRTEIADEATRINNMYMVPLLDSGEIKKTVGSVCGYLPGRRRIRVLKPSKTAMNTAQVRAFVTEQCEVGRQEEVAKGELYSRYCAWSDAPVAIKEFYRILKQEVFVEQSRKGYKDRVYILRGIGLRQVNGKNVVYLSDKKNVPGTGIETEAPLEIEA